MKPVRLTASAVTMAAALGGTFLVWPPAAPPAGAATAARSAAPPSAVSAAVVPEAAIDALLDNLPWPEAERTPGKLSGATPHHGIVPREVGLKLLRLVAARAGRPGAVRAGFDWWDPASGAGLTYARPLPAGSAGPRFVAVPVERWAAIVRLGHPEDERRTRKEALRSLERTFTDALARLTRKAPPPARPPSK